jgi:hypothetical protein
VLTRNFCVNSDEDVDIKGGGILVQGDAQFTCSGCYFDYNTADQGGALMVNNHRSKVTLLFSKFVGNRAVEGGAIAEEDSGGSIVTSCEFYDNSAWSSGGAVFAVRSALLLFDSCTFVNSSCFSAMSRGGAVALIDGRAGMKNCSITGGTAAFGGAIFAEDIVMTIDNSQINNCVARRQGGAIDLTALSRLDIRDSDIAHNKASQSGGGIFASASCKISAFNSNFNNLESEANGGAAYLEHSCEFAFDDCTFQFNRAGLACITCLFVCDCMYLYVSVVMHTWCCHVLLSFFAACGRVQSTEGCCFWTTTARPMHTPPSSPPTMP